MIKEYINKILDKKYIKSSIFLYIVSILIVMKSNKELRFYINYRVFNILIIVNKNVSLLIKKTLFRLYAIYIYNKFNIISTFNEIRVKENYEEKIAFFT